MEIEDPFFVPSVNEVPGLTFDELTKHIERAKINAEHYCHVTAVLETELRCRLPEENYRCGKCGHTRFDTQELRATQGGWGSILGVESAKYRALVCQRCKFTELYHGTVSAAQQTLDYLFGR